MEPESAHKVKYALGGKTKVPDEFRNILLEFTISYLISQPSNIADFGVSFFSKMQEAKPNPLKDEEESLPSSSSSSTDDAGGPPPELRFQRRKSVFAESYNPETDDALPPQMYPKTDEQRKYLGETMKDILLFKFLDQTQKNGIIDSMFEKNVVEGEEIIAEGEEGDFFYVVQTGLYHAFKEVRGQQKLVKTYDNRGSFGELALLYSVPRSATVKAMTAGTLWAVDRQTFRRIILKSAYEKRKLYEGLILSVPMLKALETFERMNLADALLPLEFEDGEMIIKQGDVADGMYLIEDGIVSVRVEGPNGEELEVKRATKGEYFGELALVTHKPRAATVYAVGKVKLAFLDVEAFERLLGPCMDIMKRNIDDYDAELIKQFGSRVNVQEMR